MTDLAASTNPRRRVIGLVQLQTTGRVTKADLAARPTDRLHVGKAAAISAPWISWCSEYSLHGCRWRPTCIMCRLDGPEVALQEGLHRQQSGAVFRSWSITRRQSLQFGLSSTTRARSNCTTGNFILIRSSRGSRHVGIP